MSVLAVPRSIARSLENQPKIAFRTTLTPLACEFQAWRKSTIINRGAREKIRKENTPGVKQKTRPPRHPDVGYRQRCEQASKCPSAASPRAYLCERSHDPRTCWS